MSSFSAPSSSVMSVSPFSNSPSPADETAALFDRLRVAQTDALEQPGDAELWHKQLTARRAASEAIARLARKDPQATLVYDARQLIQEVSKSGLHDRPAEAADLAQVDLLAKKGWPGILAAMLLTPSWQWSNAPLFAEVPDWLLGDYVAWIFSSPQGYSATGQAEAYAAHTLRRLEELVRWMKRSPGVALETEVLSAYVTNASVIPLYFCTGDLRRHAELRAQLYLRAVAVPNDRYEPAATSRSGRRLRVGFVNRHFGPQTETYTTLPTFEELDSERFEVILYSNKTGDSALEQYCRQKAADHFLLPDDIEGQLAMLRAAALDIVVFGTNVTAVCNEVTRLALHRVAPLQVLNNSSCITSGMPEVDLYVSGTLTEVADAAVQFSERLALLPGPTHAFNYEADRQDAQSTGTRADCGVPEDAVLFVSAANYYKIIPEMQEQWAQLLAAVPGSHLLVHPFNPNWTSDYPIRRFQAEFVRVLENHGVDRSRLAISTTSFPSRSDVKQLLSLGDIYLDTCPFGGVNSLVDPLELGLPCVTWDGRTMRARMGGALLRSLAMPQLIANTAAEYQAIARKLATDPAYRQEMKEQIRAKIECQPVFLDPLAASEAMGDLLETAYDELLATGRKAFRANSTPIQVKAQVPETDDLLVKAKAVLRTVPNDATARHIVGRSLLDQGRAARAVSYLLAAVQKSGNNADLWLDLAEALKLDGRTSEAIQALEASLRIDQNQIDGWVMLAELASAVGVTDLAREAAEVVLRLAPDDQRVKAYLQS